MRPSDGSRGPAEALRQAGFPEHIVRRLLVLHWISVVGLLIGAGYSVINVVNRSQLFLVQNALLVVFFLVATLAVRAGRGHLALEAGFLPALFVIVVLQLLSLWLGGVTIQQALYIPLTFVVLNQLSAFFALRLRQILVPTVITAIAGLAGLMLFWEQMITNPAQASGVLIAYLLVIATTLITYRQTRRASLEISLREELNREVHHRVKNEASLLLGLIDEEIEEAAGPDVAAALQRERRRIAAVLGTHKHLVAPAENRTLALDEYLTALLDPFARELSSRSHPVGINYTPSGITLQGSQAMAIGLMLNELLANALKHQSPDNHGEIDVEVRRDGKEGVRMTVSNGNATGQSVESVGNGFGLGFVKRLAETMRGQVQIRQSEFFVVEVRLPRALQYYSE